MSFQLAVYRPSVDMWYFSREDLYWVCFAGMRWHANYRVVEITKLNIVKPAYCIGRPLIRKCQCSDLVNNTSKEIKSLHEGPYMCPHRFCARNVSTS